MKKTLSIIFGIFAIVIIVWWRIALWESSQENQKLQKDLEQAQEKLFAPIEGVELLGTVVSQRWSTGGLQQILLVEVICPSLIDNKKVVLNNSFINDPPRAGDIVVVKKDVDYFVVAPPIRLRH